MTILGKNQKDALASGAAKKAYYDRQSEQLDVQVAELRQGLKREVGRAVLEALETGVPQTQISRQLLGYTHQNGIRSFFNLPMSGDIREQLTAFVNNTVIAIGGQTLTLDVEQDGIAVPLVYQRDEFDGNPRWVLERPGEGVVAQIVDARKDRELGGLQIQIPRPEHFTQAERDLIWETLDIQPDDYVGALDQIPVIG